MRYLTKTKTKISDVTITLKDDTNRATPTIILSNSSYDSRCNYVYIDTFDRYYAVTDVTYSQQKYYLTLQRDAKASFVTDLKKCECYAVRSSNKFNTYLNDPRYPHLQFTNPVIKKFPNSFNNHLSAVLTIAGGAGS